MPDQHRIATSAEFFDAARDAVESGKPLEPKRWFDSEETRLKAEARESGTKD